MGTVRQPVLCSGLGRFGTNGAWQFPGPRTELGRSCPEATTRGRVTPARSLSGQSPAAVIFILNSFLKPSLSMDTWRTLLTPALVEATKEEGKN